MKICNGVSAATAVSLLLLSGPLTAAAAGPAAINLLSAGNFTIVAKSGISNTGPTLIVGDIGVSPVAAGAIEGFSLNLAAGATFATSPLVVGRVFSPNYANPSPATAAAAVDDMQAAYADGAGRAELAQTELAGGNIGGMTIVPGLYTWTSSVTIPTNVTLSGGPDDVWIFQVAQNLDVAPAASIVLTGGAQSKNIYWVVAGQTSVGSSAIFYGNILDKTAIVLNSAAQLHGRALAQTSVTLDSNSVTAVSSPVVGFGSFGSTAGQQLGAIGVDLTFGSRGVNVAALQQFLISQNTGPAAGALSAAGATSYFGLLTRAALAEFQSSVGVRPAAGYFGPITRRYIGSHF